MTDMVPAWVGELTPTAALIVIALLAVTGKLVWHKWAERQLARVEKERDDAIEALRESQAINRVHAEATREAAQTLEAVAEAQGVILKIVQALPRARGGDRG